MPKGLPPDPAAYALEDGTVVVKVLRELIFYVPRIEVETHDALIRLYQGYLPKGRDRFFQIPELTSWSPVADPRLTESARAQRGRPLAELEAVRRRIAERRWFFSRLWDGRKIDDPTGSFSLDIQRRRLEDGTWAGYVRVLLPADTSDTMQLSLALEMLDTVPVISGHGGFCFTYVPERKSSAFDRIFAMARRYAGVDIEDLPVTLPHMGSRVKPACWLNVIGRAGGFDASLWRRMHAIGNLDDATATERHHGVLLQLSETPPIFDLNHGDLPTAPYRAFDEATAAIRLAAIGTFSGPRFGADPDATEAWLARFASPEVL